MRGWVAVQNKLVKKLPEVLNCIMRFENFVVRASCSLAYSTLQIAEGAVCFYKNQKITDYKTLLDAESGEERGKEK